MSSTIENASGKARVEFDDFADDYDAALATGLQATGESKIYFIRRRIGWLQARIAKLKFSADRILDYGCGHGDTSEALIGALSAKSYLGLDVSPKSIAIARERHASDCCDFAAASEIQHVRNIDLTYCNGVFHHIPVEQRVPVLRQIRDCLRHDGLFAFWENNPWNPGTRWIMKRIPFDRDAVVIKASEAQRLLRQAGFEIVSTSYLFIFPRQLNWLRGLEPSLAWLPIGGQYMILARRTK